MSYELMLDKINAIVNLSHQAIATCLYSLSRCNDLSLFKSGVRVNLWRTQRKI